MKTEIEFLSLLEQDLAMVTELEGETITPVLRKRTPPTRRLLAVMAAAFVVLAGVLGYALGDRGQDETAPLAQLAGPATRQPTDRAHGPGPLAPIQGRPFDGEVGFGQTRGRDIYAAEDSTGTAGPSSEAFKVGPKIVKSASLDVQVKKGSFAQAFRDASLIADRYGGYIASSSMSGSSAKQGTLTMRVPARKFSLAVADLTALGQTVQERIDGEDVTADYVDLQGRIRTWTAQERVLLRLMADAQSIDQTLTVQRHLQNVQLEIEQLKGQLRVLRDQVADGTITIALRERAPRQEMEEAHPIAPGFGDTWRKAAGGFLDVLSAVAIGLGYLVPTALMLIGIWLLVRSRIRVRA